MKTVIAMTFVVLGFQANAADEANRLQQISTILASTPDVVFQGANARNDAKELIKKTLVLSLDICFVGRELEIVRSGAGEQAAQDNSCESIIKSAGLTLTKEEIQTVISEKTQKIGVRQPVPRTFLK